MSLSFLRISSALSPDACFATIFFLLHCLHLVQDSFGELLGRVLAAHVTRADLALSNDGVDSLGDSVRVIVEAKVAEEHASREDQSAGVGLVLALDIEADVSAARFEYSHVTAHVAAGHNTRAAD